MFGGDEDDEEELEVLFCLVESLGVAVFVEREPVFAVLFFEFADESRGGVPRIEWPAPTRGTSSGRCRPTAAGTKEAA